MMLISISDKVYHYKIIIWAIRSTVMRHASVAYKTAIEEKYLQHRRGRRNSYKRQMKPK